MGHLGAEPQPVTLPTDARGFTRAVTVEGTTVSTGDIGDSVPTADLTRSMAQLSGARAIGELAGVQRERFYALAMLRRPRTFSAPRAALTRWPTEYAKIREQYGKPIGSYQAVAHLLAEGLALIEGSISVLRHAAWGVDELDTDEAIRAA